MFYVVFCIAYADVYYFDINFSGLITSVCGESANLSAIVYSYFFCFCLKEFSLPLGVYDRLLYFI